MIEKIKNNKLKILTVLLYLISFITYQDIFYKSIDTFWMYLKEMLSKMPAVIVATGLINVWVPKEVIMKHFGDNSGLKGSFNSILIGAFSAGPIYAAFPLAQTLFRKGASINNIVIIISSWAVIKVPMLIVEAKFLGLKFASTRYILTVPGIILLGYLTSMFVSQKDFNIPTIDLKIEKIYKALPKLDCQNCGYKTCKKYANAIVYENERLDLCIDDKLILEEIIKGD